MREALAYMEENVKVLESLRNKARKYRKKSTADFIEILDRVRELEALPRNQRQAILVHDCGFSLAEANQILSAAACEIQDRELLVNRGVGADVIVALQRVNDAIRDAAYEQITSGKQICQKTLSKLKQRAEATDPIAAKRKRTSLLAAQAARRAKAELEAYLAELAGFVEHLIDFHEIDDLDEGLLDLKMSELSARAEQLLDGFVTLLGDDHPEVTEWFFDRGNPEPVRVAKAKWALERLRAKDFADAEFIDPEADRYIEAGIIGKIAWLCSADIDRLKESVEARRNDTRDSMRVGVEQEPRTLTSLEICAGAGGQAIGLHAAGFRALGVFEVNSVATATLKKNYTFGALFTRDIKEVDFSIYRGEVDLLAGGVPCQAHSQLGKKAGRADKRDLFREAVEIVETVRPRAFMFENVSGFTAPRNATYRAEIFTRLEAAGYDVQLLPIVGAEYGLGQNRPRVVLIGFRDGLMLNFTMPPVLPDAERTVGDVLLPFMSENGWKGAEAWAKRANKPAPTLVGGSSKTGIKGFASNFQLEAWAKLGIDASDLADDAPSADAPVDHMPKLTRHMAARLQGFPANWKFCGSAKQQRQQIGNAFPPIMARAVGLAIYNVLEGADRDILKELQTEFVSYPLGSVHANYGSTLKAQELDLPRGEQFNPGAHYFRQRLALGS